MAGVESRWPRADGVLGADIVHRVDNGTWKNVGLNCAPSLAMEVLAHAFSRLDPSGWLRRLCTNLYSWHLETRR